MYKQMLLIVMLFGCASVQAATGYRCEKIEDGNKIVEYAQLRIEGYNCVDLRETPPPPVDPETEMQKLRERANLPNAEERREEQAAAARATRRAENCETAKSNIQLLESDQDVARTDEKGEKVLLNETERAAALKAARENVRLYCNS